MAPLEWGTQSDWENATKSNINVVNDTFELVYENPEPTLDTHKERVDGTVSELSAQEVSSGTYELRAKASVEGDARTRIYAGLMTNLPPAEYNSISFYLDSITTSNHNFHVTLWHIPSGNFSDIFSGGTQLKDWGQPSANQTLSYDLSGNSSTDGTIAVVNSGSHYYAESDTLYFTFSQVSEP